MSKNNAPSVTGRFNYICFRKSLYNLLFVIEDSPISVTVATNLSWDEMTELRNKLNKTLDDTRQSFWDMEDVEEGERE